MCVKEFYGFNCGHCSVPYLRQCPLTLSNEQFSPCGLPAERPIFTNDNCHACSRVLWNARVLKEEAEHRSRHECGKCFCETVFRSPNREKEQGRQREQRLWTRGGKNKGKGKGFSHTEDGTDYEDSRTSASQKRPIGGVGGMFGGSYATMDRSNDQGQHPLVGDDVYTGPQDRMMKGVEQQVEVASYEYVGYPYGATSQADTDLAQTGNWFGFSDNGYILQGRLSTSQMVLGQPNAGMKWYPEQNLPALPPIPGYSPPAQTKKHNRVPRIWQQKAKSEPFEKQEDVSSPEFKALSAVGSVELNQAPMIVSSDMIANGIS